MQRTQSQKQSRFSRSELAECWRLVKPWWTSEEKWIAIGLYTLVLFFDLASVAIATWLTYWNKNFFNAFTDYDLSLVWWLLGQAVVIAICSVLTEIFRTWFYQTLEIRWRKWITEVYLKKWLSGSVFHRIETIETIDNTDQRISEDLREMVSQTLNLSLGFIRNVVNLISFSIIIWGISGTLSFSVLGLTINIPGYMLWISIIYALVASIMMEKWGNKMVAVEYEQQLRESDFRFLMMRIRENSAQIAISNGGKSEHKLLRKLFGGIELNWDLVKIFTRRITFVEKFYTEFGIILAYLIIIPRYFAREITLGSIMQLTMSFTRVRVGFAWFIFQYKRLTTLRSMFRRLSELSASLSEEDSGSIIVDKKSDNTLSVEDLTLYLPNGQLLTHIGSLRINAGSRWLIKGHSGVGKTTLLRAISGLWTYGSGHISLPKGRMMFLPQESYLPLGNLKTALCYPEPTEKFSIEECARVMNECGLSPYIDKLDEENIYWSKKFSPGEKQRLAFARALLLCPDFLFMDEATSALDLRMEQQLFSILLSKLSQTTIISVAHRPSLDKYHDHIFEISINPN